MCCASFSKRENNAYTDELILCKTKNFLKLIIKFRRNTTYFQICSANSYSIYSNVKLWQSFQCGSRKENCSYKTVWHVLLQFTWKKRLNFYYHLLNSMILWSQVGFNVSFVSLCLQHLSTEISYLHCTKTTCLPSHKTWALYFGVWINLLTY